MIPGTDRLNHSSKSRGELPRESERSNRLIGTVDTHDNPGRVGFFHHSACEGQRGRIAAVSLSVTHRVARRCSLWTPFPTSASEDPRREVLKSQAGRLEKPAARRGRPKNTAEQAQIAQLSKELVAERAAHERTRGKLASSDAALDTLGKGVAFLEALSSKNASSPASVSSRGSQQL